MLPEKMSRNQERFSCSVFITTPATYLELVRTLVVVACSKIDFDRCLSPLTLNLRCLPAVERVVIEQLHEPDTGDQDGDGFISVRTTKNLQAWMNERKVEGRGLRSVTFHSCTESARSLYDMLVAEELAEVITWE
jgi:hypothetical protein